MQASFYVSAVGSFLLFIYLIFMKKMLRFILYFTGFLAFFAQAENGAFEVVTLDTAPLSKRILLGATVVPLTEVELGAQVAGDIIKFDGKAGDAYKKGELIVALEKESIRAQREVALADIASANEMLNNAGVQYSKSIISPYSDGNMMFGGMPGMFSTFINPMQRMTGGGNAEFEKYAHRANSYSHYVEAGNRLKQAKSKLKGIDEKLKDASVVAPFDGIIVKKVVDMGDSVQKGKTLLIFANISQLQVEVHIPSRLLLSLKKGAQYRVKLDISNYVVNALLTQIYPVANRDTHTIRTKFSLPKNAPVVPGSYAELELFDLSQSKQTVVLPETALIWRSSLPSVFIVNDENKTELRFVRIGDKVSQDKISILSGLKKGERIIVNPGVLTVSGMSI